MPRPGRRRRPRLIRTGCRSRYSGPRSRPRRSRGSERPHQRRRFAAAGRGSAVLGRLDHFAVCLRLQQVDRGLGDDQLCFCLAGLLVSPGLLLQHARDLDKVSFVEIVGSPLATLAPHLGGHIPGRQIFPAAVPVFLPRCFTAKRISATIEPFCSARSSGAAVQFPVN